jgi:hypothetical protein
VGWVERLRNPSRCCNDMMGIAALYPSYGLQLTPQISIEGGVGFTQMQSSNFR